MSAQKTKRLEYKDLKQGDIVWSTHFECYLVFEEAGDFDDEFYYWFRRLTNKNVVLLNTTEIYEVSELMKELL